MHGYDPKASIKLMVLLYQHRGALAFDLRSRLNISLEDLFRHRISWNEVAAYVDELLKDPYSHSAAALNDWSFVPNPMDVFYLNWIDAQAQMHHRSGKVPPKPVRRPWEHGGDAKSSPPDPDSQDRRKALRERLGFGSVIDADDEPDREPEAESDD